MTVALSLPPAPVQRVLAGLSGVKAKGSYWIARCPAHDDQTASLSVGVGRDGRCLLKCHAGCSSESIVGAIGLTMAELFPPREPNSAPSAPAGSAAPSHNVLVKTYDYVDRDGTLLFQVCRMRQPDGTKTFRQRRPDGKGEWIWGLGDTAPVLYRWPEVAAAIESGRPVYVVEGEKDADTLAELGYAATTNPMGAGKWREPMSAALAGADLVILPDNDGPGRTHAETIAASCHRQGASVRVVELPGLGEKQDVTDWLDADGTLEELETLIGASRLWTPKGSATKALWRLDEILANDEIMRPPMPVIPRLAWQGSATCIASAAKSGKSTFTGYLATQVSLGGTFLGDPCHQGPVLILALEEALGHLGRRLRHFGAKATAVHVVHEMPAEAHARPQALRDYIDTVQPLLVIVDTLIAYARGMIENENDAAQTQAVVQELTDIAHRTNRAMLINHHANKEGRYRGSSAIIGAVDMMVELVPSEDPHDLTLRKAKCRGRMPVHDFEFRYDGSHYTIANAMGIPLIQRVLDFIRANPGQSLSAVRKSIGGKAELVDEALNALHQKRFITDSGDTAGHAYEASAAAPASFL